MDTRRLVQSKWNCKYHIVFSDETLANAILDRLLHHSHIIKIVGSSYRTKDVYEDSTRK